MLRKNNRSSKKLDEIKNKYSKKPWYSTSFSKGVVVGGIIGSIVTFSLSTVVQVPAFLSSLRVIPHEYKQTKTEFLGWYHEDHGWNGLWSDFPEGYVDMEDMNLSKTEVKIILQSNNGILDGVIASKGICGNFYIPPSKDLKEQSKKKVPAKELTISDHYIFNYSLVTGKVSGSNTADISVFDIIGGKKVVFANLKLKRNGVIMEIIPENKNNIVLNKPIRIAQHPDLDSQSAYEYLNEYCKHAEQSQ